MQLRPVDRDHADLRQPSLRAQRQHLAEQARQRVLVAHHEARDSGVIGLGLRRDHAVRDVVPAARSIAREDRIPRA